MDIEGHPEAAKFGQPRRLRARAKGDSLRSGSTYQGRIPREIPARSCPLLAGHESHRIIVSDAKGLRRRAELLLALANKARDDNYTELADYILDRADQLFEEARIREL